MKSHPRSQSEELLASEITEFWMKALARYHRVQLQNGGKAKLISYTKDKFISSILKTGGQIHLLRDSRKKLKAAILIKSGSLMPEHQPKLPFWCFCIFTQPGDRNALNWVGARLNEQKEILRQGSDGAIDPWQSPLIPNLRRIGIYPTSITLKGEVSLALKRLRFHYGKKLLQPLAAHRLTIEPAKTNADIEGYIRVIKREFTKNPQFGTFVAEPSFLNGLRTELNKSLEQKQDRLWVVRRGKKILGGVDYSPISPDLNGKNRVSFGVNLAQELQGKNVARCLYATVLAELEKNKVVAFRGGTAQPGVMRLSKIMGRRFDGILVESSKKSLFPKNHFRDWFQG